MKFLLSAGALVVAATNAAADAPPAPPPTPAPACFGSGLTCTNADFGVALTREHDPKRVVAIIGGARKTFEMRFGAAPAPSAFIEDDTAISRYKRLRDPLIAAGYPVVLPWPAPSVFKSALAQQEAALRKKFWYLPEGVKKQAIEKVMNEVTTLVAYDAIAHEYGHLWLVAEFWGVDELKLLDRGHYGGPAADWLDETAAILMEPEGLAATRRDGLKKARKSKAPYLTPLATFVTMKHPTTDDPGKPSGGKGPGVTIDIGGETDGASTLYYVQCWAFAEFLIETSGDPVVFRAIATSAARGETFAQWLAKEGASYRLPRTIAALDTAWRAWLDRKYPK